MKQSILATACFFAGLVTTSPTKGHSENSGNIVVKYPESIQAAIDKASPGSTIRVKSGTYAEQLLITKDGITLKGERGTKLVPPTVPVPADKQNGCYGSSGPETIAGICVFGQDVVLADYDPVTREHRFVNSVGRRVKDVTIQGFEINGFPGENIALYGAEDAVVKDNVLIDGLVYGYLAAGSKNTIARGNKIISTGLSPFGFRFIGACSDNRINKDDGATVWDNDIHGYGIGLCLQTSKANYQHNHITNGCIGIFVDPGIDGAKVRHNTVGPANPDCAENFGGATNGIVLFGATNTEVQHNTVTGQDLGIPAAPGSGSGIAIFDAPTSLASGNRVNRNDFSKNVVDIVDFSSGGGNVFKANTCTTPANLCAR